MKKKLQGPKGHFLTGNVKEFGENPPLFLLKLLKEYGRVASFQLGPYSCILLSDPSLVQELLIEKADLFEKGKKGRKIISKMLGNGLVTSEGEFHKKQRLLVQPAFRKKYLDGYSNAMLQYTDKKKNEWTSSSHIDLAAEMMDLTMNIVSKSLFGLDVSKRSSQIGEAIMELQELTQKDMGRPFNIPTFLPTPDNLRRKKLLMQINPILDDIIQQHRHHKTSVDEKRSFSLMDALFEASEEEGLQPMEDKQLRDELITLFFAGHETTSNALAWTWYELSQHPEIEKRFHQELDEVTQGKPLQLKHLPQLKYTTMIFKESMRLHPPAWSLIGRAAKEDVEIGDYMFPKGSLTFIAPYVLHRIEEFFPNPEQFQPERFSPEQEKQLPRHLYIPFGTGHRICVGRSFAMMEGILILASIGQKFHFRYLSEQKAEMNPLITLAMKGGLPVEVLQRTHSS